MWLGRSGPKEGEETWKGMPAQALLVKGGDCVLFRCVRKKQRWSLRVGCRSCASSRVSHTCCTLATLAGRTYGTAAL